MKIFATGNSSIISTNTKDEQVILHNDQQQHNLEKDGSIDWKQANGHANNHSLIGGTDSMEILLEQLRNAQDDVQVCLFLEALVAFLSNQKVIKLNNS